MPTGDPFCPSHGFVRCSCGEPEPKILLLGEDAPPPPPPTNGTLSARHRVALKFGWPLVNAIERDEVELMFANDAMRLRRVEIDHAIKKAAPVFTDVVENMTRLADVESVLTRLGEAWIDHRESWWVRVVELMLEDTEHPAKRGLRSVLDLAVHTAQKRR